MKCRITIAFCVIMTLCFSCAKEESMRRPEEPLFHYYLELDFLKDGKSIINNSTDLFADQKNLTVPHSLIVESDWGEVFQKNVTGVADKEKFRLMISGYIFRGSFNSDPDGKVLLTIKLNIPALNEDRTEIISLELHHPGMYRPSRLYNVTINGTLMPEQEKPVYTINLD